MVEVYEFKSGGNFHIPYKKRVVIARAALKDGKFKFKDIKVNEPRAVNLIFGDSLSLYAVAFLEPGNIEINISPKDTIVFEKKPGIEVSADRKGSINNSLFSEYRTKRLAIESNPKYDVLKDYDREAFSQYPDLDIIFDSEDKYGDMLDKKNEEVYNFKDAFIKNHNDKMVSPYMVVYEDYGFTDEYQEKEITAFFNNYNKNLEGNTYYEMMKTVTQAYEAKVAVAVDFTIKDDQGKDVTLSSLRGKYVLLDFWAYWCKPCIATFPHLKELREKYKDDGFEILGVSVDPNEKKWFEAIKAHKPTWPQLIDNKEKTVAKQFEIVQYPTTILIGKEGHIVSRDADLEAELKEIFGY